MLARLLDNVDFTWFGKFSGSILVRSLGAGLERFNLYRVFKNVFLIRTESVFLR